MRGSTQAAWGEAPKLHGDKHLSITIQKQLTTMKSNHLIEKAVLQKTLQDGLTKIGCSLSTRRTTKIIKK
jgi:hypothetical protein